MGQTMVEQVLCVLRIKPQLAGPALIAARDIVGIVPGPVEEETDTQGNGLAALGAQLFLLFFLLERGLLQCGILVEALGLTAGQPAFGGTQCLRGGRGGCCCCTRARI